MADLQLPADTLRRLQEAISRKDNSGLGQMLEALAIPAETKEAIRSLPRLFGGREILAKAAQTVRNERSQRALANLEQVLDILEVYGVERHITIDLGEIRGLDYHTGITFQGFLPGLGRAVCSGGRYDNLTARYGRKAAATGFTFNLLNLLFALDRELDRQVTSQTDVLLFQLGGNKRPAQLVARALRSKGYSAARDMYPRSLDESLDYAQKMDFRFIMIIGEQDQPIRLIRTGDRHEETTSLAAIQADGFVL